MTGHVYAVASGKGGVGKTTTVINLGVNLRMANHTVALVDADLGMANLSTLLGIDHEPTIHGVLAGEADLDDAVVEEVDGFGIIPGARALSGFAEADPSGLDRVLETLAERYDYVLVDTASGLSHEAVLPLVAAEGVILVTEPNRAAIGDTQKTAELVDLVGGTLLGVVVTKSYEGLDTQRIADSLGTGVLAEIPVDPAVAASLAAEKPLQGHSPDGPAAAAYRQLAERLSAGTARAEATQPETSHAPAREADAVGEDGPGLEEEAPAESVAAAVGDDTETVADEPAPGSEDAVEAGDEVEAADETEDEEESDADVVEQPGGDRAEAAAEPEEDAADAGAMEEPDEDETDADAEEPDEVVDDAVDVDDLGAVVGTEDTEAADEAEDTDDLDAAVTWGEEDEEEEEGETVEVAENEKEEEEDRRSGGFFARLRRLFG